MSAFYTTVARYYDAENADKTDDIDFYKGLLTAYPGPVLEIGCGCGRVVLPLARDGHTVHGIDNDATMLGRARKRVEIKPDAYPHLTLQEGDILTDEIPGGPFASVLMSYNMLMHFHHQPQQITLLERLRAVAADDALLVLDLPNAGEMFATPDSDAITLERTFIEPETGHMVMQQAVSVLDRATQMMRVSWIYDEITGDGTLKRTVAPTLFRYFFPYEVQLLLNRCGWGVDTLYGDTDGSPFEDGAPRMIVLASAK
jgi:SAM-dependent methyltransferase